MAEPTEPHKFKVYGDDLKPTEMTSDELSAVILKATTTARFPHLCVAFEDAALQKLAAHIEGMDVNSSDEDWKSVRRVNKAVLKMSIKGTFYEAAIKVTPPVGGLKKSLMHRFETFNYQCIDKVAELLNDGLGPHRASQTIPEPMRSELNAEISDQMGLNNLSLLIRKSLTLN